MHRDRGSAELLLLLGYRILEILDILHGNSTNDVGIPPIVDKPLFF